MFVCLLRQLCPNTHETIIAREELTQEKNMTVFLIVFTQYLLTKF